MTIKRIWDRSPVLTGTVKNEASKSFENILITGGAGFIGSWLTRHLVVNYASEYRVIVMDNLEYCASLNNVRHLERYPNFRMIHGDIKNECDVLRVLKRYNIDVVFHLAAQSHVDQSFKNSYKFTNDNVGGTHTLLECATRMGIRRFIHVSTDEVTGEVETGAPDLLEDAILAPTNPYAASKAAAEMYVNAYAKSFQLPTIVVRVNNVYGPHQFPEKLIPKLCCLILRGQPLPLHGDGRNTRRYMYASDVVDALDTVLHQGQVGQTYNIASADEISNLGLADKLLGIFASTTDVRHSSIHFISDRPFNDRRYATDGSKIKQLGWTQKVGFDEGLKRTVEWYAEFGSGWWGDIADVVGIQPSAASLSHKHQCYSHHQALDRLRQLPIKCNTLPDVRGNRDGDGDEDGENEAACKVECEASRPLSQSPTLLKNGSDPYLGIDCARG